MASKAKSSNNNDDLTKIKKELSTTKGQLTRTKNEKEDLEKQLEAYQSQVESLRQETTQLIEEKNGYVYKLAELENSTVGKEKLKSEGLQERLNWYYKDLEGWEKIAAHGLALLGLGLIVGGVYLTTKNITDAGQASEYISTIVTLVLGLLGVNFQAKALRTPKPTEEPETDVTE